MTKPTAEAVARQQIEKALKNASAVYSGSTLKGLRIVSVDLSKVSIDATTQKLVPEKGKANATVIFELEVTQEMCNPRGSMHGGCGAFLLDLLSSMPLIAISNDQYWTTSGVSQNFNLFLMKPIPKGVKVRITAYILTLGSRSAVTEARFTDESGQTLFIHGNHTKVNPFQKPVSKL